MVMYHGTPNGNFTVFKEGTYFTANEQYAERYQDPSSSSISYGKEKVNPKTYAVYLNITKPFDIRNDSEARRIYIEDYIKGGNALGINPYESDAFYDDIKEIDWAEGEDLRDFLIEEEYDYDGLVLDEGADGGYGAEVAYRGDSYVAFSPEQIKSITFNPVSSSHWIKSVFFDRKDPDVYTHHSTYLDNRFIDKAYHRRMMRRKEIDPEGYRIYGLGEWGEVGGLILTNYVIEDFNTNLERFDYMVNAQDFGYNHADAIGEVGFKDGELYLCKEIYEFEKDTDELIELANKKGFRKELTMYCDSAEPDRIKMWKKAGYRAVPVKKTPGSVHAQIDFLKQHKIHIHPSCVNTIKEIQQWKWKKDEKTNTYLDEPVNIFDDAMAMLRYSIEEERKEKSKLNRSFKGGF